MVSFVALVGIEILILVACAMLLSMDAMRHATTGHRMRFSSIFRQSVAWFWDWSAKWPWYSIWFALWITMQRLHEYAVALFCAVLAAFGLWSKLMHWKGLSSRLWRNVLKALGTCGILIVLAFACYITVDEKDEGRPWSHLSKPFHEFIEAYWTYTLPRWTQPHNGLLLLPKGWRTMGPFGTKQPTRPPSSGENAACGDDVNTCSVRVLIKWALEMATGIDDIYQRYGAKKEEITNQYYETPESERTGDSREGTAFLLEVEADRALNEYRNKYRANAHAYRVAMEKRIGPTAHDAEKDKLYEITDSQPLNTNGKVRFLSNWQVDNLPKIADDLRSLTARLPESSPQKRTPEDRGQYVCGLKSSERRLFAQALADAPAGSLALISIGDSRDTPSKDCYDLLPSLFPKDRWTVQYVGGGMTYINSDGQILDSRFTCFAKDEQSAPARALKSAFQAVDLRCDWSHPHSELMSSGDIGVLVNPMPH
jgi:hypothetical protein